MINRFCIKKNYISRQSYTHFDDTLNEDEWQLEVYLKAREIMEVNNYKDVLDVGCGSGFKLMKYLGNFNTIGTELKVNLNFLKNKFPKNKWIESNFETSPSICSDLIICADVIEHLINPDELMIYLHAIDFKILLISTPERDLVYDTGSEYLNGPPRNLTHVREWNYQEFNNYVKKYFVIENHYISNHQQSTQLILCKKS